MEFVTPTSVGEAVTRHASLKKKYQEIVSRLTELKKTLREHVGYLGHDEWKEHNAQKGPLVAELLQINKEMSSLKSYVEEQVRLGNPKARMSRLNNKAAHRKQSQQIRRVKRRFEEPVSLDDAYGRRVELVAELKSLESELASPPHHARWLRPTRQQKLAMEAELSCLNEWVRSHIPRHLHVDWENIGDTPLELLVAARLIIMRHVVWDNLNQKEQEVIKKIEVVTLAPPVS